MYNLNAFQAESEQRPHKVSFYVEKDKAQEVMKALAELLENRGVRFHIELIPFKNFN